MRRAYLILAFCLSLIPAHTIHAKSVLNPLCFGRLSQIDRSSLSGQVERAFAFYQNQLRHLERLPAQLLYATSRIDPGYAPVLRNAVQSGDQGASNFGILEVRNDEGKRIIVKMSLANAAFRSFPKFDGTDTFFDGKDLNHPTFQEYVLIHKVLGDLGYALKLEGIVPHEELYTWLAKVDALHGTQFSPKRKSPAVGLILENIPGAWNITRRDPPPYLPLLTLADVDRVLERIVELESVLNGLWIDARDLQVFLSPDGRVLLGDLDDFTLSDGSDQPNTLDFVARDFVKAWEGATHKTYPKQRYQELLGRKKKDPDILRKKAFFRREAQRLKEWYKYGGAAPGWDFHRHR